MDKSAFRTFGLNRSVQLSSQWAEMMKDQKYRDMFEVIFETMRDLVLIGRRRGYEWDLHANNFMMRGDTPVIIDPWVNETMHESTDPENG
jgi:hypothetical protein